MSKNMVDPERPQKIIWRMCAAHGISKATRAHEHAHAQSPPRTRARTHAHTHTQINM